jgi:hypothetical protein
MPQIALLGAPGSGKATLARALEARLAQHGMDAQVVVVDALASVPALRQSGSTIHLLCAPVEASDAMGEAESLRWREALARATIPYSVLHGDAKARLECAWNLMAPTPSAAPPTRWSWQCDKCSDPACEHRLLRDLLAGRE